MPRPAVAAYIVWMHCSHWRRATFGFRWVEDRAMDIAVEREWRPWEYRGSHRLRTL